MAHKILVVDDEAIVRMNGVDMLEEAGFEVIEARSADAALEILQQAQDVELLFSDVDMPGSMDGLALARLVHERWPDIKLLLTSGHQNITDADVPDAGRFIPKPYSADDVIGDVNDLLNR